MRTGFLWVYAFTYQARSAESTGLPIGLSFTQTFTTFRVKGLSGRLIMGLEHLGIRVSI